jgi:hypothetical protein
MRNSEDWPKRGRRRIVDTHVVVRETVEARNSVDPKTLTR